jgi:ketosteroid isomerase-like protein
MKKFLLAFSSLLALVPVGISQKVDVATELQSVVRAERAFALMAAEKGTRAAFLANMTDDAVVFGPTGAGNGKKVWTARPEGTGLLSWEPVYADVARAGDIAYTTGPWVFRPNGPNNTPAAHGQFFTIWRKEPDGTWKWILDIGISHPAPLSSRPALSFPYDFRKTTDKDKLDFNVASVEKELLKTEREFLKASTNNTLEAFAKYSADDIRTLREESYPILGKESLRKSLTSTPGTLTWETVGSGASRSGELAYTYGTYELRRAPASDKTASVERGNYVRVWKKKQDGKWRVVLDLLNPFPPQPAN